MRYVFITLAFLSGSVALSHELLWTRRLIDLLGATESVTGRVLGLFFLGLSLGGWLATRWSRGNRNSAVRLAIAEISIAVLSLPALFLPLWADGLVATLGTDLLISWQGGLIKALVAAAVVLPPAIAMGMTMPMFIQVISDLGGTLRRGGIWIYSINMLGGVFGLWLVSTFLLEVAGVRGAMLCAAVGNILIGGVSFGVSGRIRSGDAVDETFDTDAKEASVSSLSKNERSGSGIKYVLMLAFVSGFVVLASEILTLRLLALVSPSSIQTTSALLANVILFLALGSVFVTLLNRFRISSETQLIVGMIGGALFCLLCPLILYETTNKLVSIRYLVASTGSTIGSISEYWLLLFAIVAWSSGAAMFFFGFVFPSIMSIHSRRDPAGRSVGLLLAVNGLGGLLGAELANLLMVFQVGIYRGFVLLSALTAISGIAICLYNQKKIAAVGIACVALLVGVLSSDAYRDLRYMSPRAQKRFTVEDTRFGREGVLMVINDAGGSRSLLMNNQYILGGSGTAATPAEQRQLLVPWLLHPQAKKVCCLGFATGITSTALEVLQDPPEVTSAELSGKVVEVAREFFSKEHTSFFERDGNQVLLEDARIFMACADEEYDLIVADLFRPFGAGESRLFSVEHYQNVKKALRPGGLFCHWLPAHQLNQSQFETIAKTFQEVFPNTLVISGSKNLVTPMIGLCAWKEDQQWETEDLVKKIGEVRKQKGISDVLTLNPQLLIVGVLKKDAVSSAPINTLDNALLEIDAGKFWITKDLRRRRSPDTLENGFLSGDNWKRFVLDLMKKTEPVLDPIHRQQFLQPISPSDDRKCLYTDACIVLSLIQCARKRYEHYVTRAGFKRIRIPCEKLRQCEQTAPTKQHAKREYPQIHLASSQS